VRNRYHQVTVLFLERMAQQNGYERFTETPASVWRQELYRYFGHAQFRKEFLE